MAGFRSVKKYTDAWEAGRVHTAHFRKAPNPTTAGWADLSMQGGGPPANYYASDPLAAARLTGSRGIYAGDDKAPSKKYLTAMSAVATSVGCVGVLRLCDYVLYYPFIDADSVDTQTLDNTTTLNRYEDGEGVMVMAVFLTAVTPTSGQFTFEYVNQNGVTKTSPVISCSTFGGAITTGTIVTGLRHTLASGPFLALAGGDTGVRQINSITFSSVNGGLIALVMVKPLMDLPIRELNAEVEVEVITQRSGPIEVKDGAYLNLLHFHEVSLGSTFTTGKLQFIWDEGT